MAKSASADKAKGSDDDGDQVGGGGPPGQEPGRSFADDLGDLRAFVGYVRNLLDAIVDDGRHIPPDSLDDLRAAWPHARSDLDALVVALSQQDDGPQIEPQLERHGLTGAPLRLKLRAWRKRCFRFGRRQNKRWLRSVLRWSDTILGSLVDAMTVGAAGKEFKEAVENFLVEAEEDTR